MKTYRIATTGVWTSDAFQKELEALTRHVRLCFEEATTQFAPPSEGDCRHFANCLLTYFLPDKKSPLGSDKKTIKYGKTFLKHLALERESVKLILRLPNAYVSGEARETAEITRFHMEEAERHVNYILDYLSPNKSSKNEPIRFLAGYAQDLWKKANAGRAPRSRKPNGPLCRLLLSVLQAINRNPRPATIIEALRGRR